MSLSWTPDGTVSGSFADGPSSGRCAGPLQQELARILIRGRRSHARQATYDFRASAPFTAGPFTGTLVSTLVLSPAGPGSGSSSIGSSSGSVHAHKVLFEQVILRYRVTAPPSALGVSFAGEAGPFCVALNTCRATGDLSLAFPRLESELEIAASRIVKSPVSRRQALRDFRAGRLPFEGPPSVGWVTPRLSETFADAGRCADAVSVPSLGLGFAPFGPGTGREIPVNLFDSGATDPLRTHCPGPEAADALGFGDTLASAKIPRRELLQRNWTFTVRAAGGFSAPGYVGARSGELPVTMSLLKVIAGTGTGRSS